MDRPTGRLPPASPGIGRMAFSGLVALLVGIGFGRFGFTPLVPGLVQAGWLGEAVQAVVLHQVAAAPAAVLRE